MRGVVVVRVRAGWRSALFARRSGARYATYSVSGVGQKLPRILYTRITASQQHSAARIRTDAVTRADQLHEALHEPHHLDRGRIQPSWASRAVAEHPPASHQVQNERGVWRETPTPRGRHVTARGRHVTAGHALAVVVVVAALAPSAVGHGVTREAHQGAKRARDDGWCGDAHVTHPPDPAVVLVTKLPLRRHLARPLQRPTHGGGAWWSGSGTRKQEWAVWGRGLAPGAWVVWEGDLTAETWCAGSTASTRRRHGLWAA